MAETRLIRAVAAHRLALRGLASELWRTERALMVARLAAARQAPRGSCVDLIASAVDDLRTARWIARELAAELAEDFPEREDEDT